MHWYPAPPVNTSIERPISPTYQSVLHREVETLFGTTKRATAGVLVHPVCFSYLCDVYIHVSHAYHVQHDVMVDHGLSANVSIRVITRTPPIKCMTGDANSRNCTMVRSTSPCTRDTDHWHPLLLGNGALSVYRLG